MQLFVGNSMKKKMFIVFGMILDGKPKIIHFNKMKNIWITFGSYTVHYVRLLVCIKIRHLTI